MKYLNVEKVTQISDEIYEVFLIRDDVEHKVGNCIAIYGADEKTSRPYSFASGVDDPFLSFIIKKVPNGYVSSYLCTLKQGDRVKVSNPYGWFEPGSDPKSIYISTGTGIAPFISSLRTRMSPPIKFYIGTKYYKDLDYYLDYIKGKTVVEHCVSREDHAGCHRAHVSEILQKQLPDHGDDVHYYLCGLDSMISECSHILICGGIPTEHIHHECFFNSDD